MRVFKVNEYITLKLEQGKTVIYIQKRPFMICKRLLLHIPIDSLFVYNKIDSIDEATEVYKKNLMDGNIFEGLNDGNPIQIDISITSEEEFWGHCSNIQVWADYDYDTRLLHSNIAFPLLKRLTELGDNRASQIFSMEIVKRFEKGHLQTVNYLLDENYLKYLSLEELDLVLFNLVKNFKKDLIEKLNIEKVLENAGDKSKDKLIDILFQHLTHRKILKLGRKQLKYIPNSVGNLSYLKELYLYDNLLVSVPEAIGELKSIEKLYLHINKLLEIPETIGNLKSLQVLFLYNNKLRTIPESIGNLAKLKELTLEENDLTSLPESISKLYSLEQLYLDDNKLSSLPKAIGNLSALNYLSIGGNQINQLPESIGHLSSLKYLLSAENELTTLPESIGNLTSLEELDLSNNYLTSLPKSIGQLNSLKNLFLGNNKITNLPETIGNLYSIEELFLDHNNLSSIPLTIGNLYSLQTLKISSNPIENLLDVLNSLKQLLNLKTIIMEYTPAFTSDIRPLIKHFEQRGISVFY